MKVAFVSQPWDTLRPPVSAGSIPIWTYKTAKVLAARCEVVIYARRSDQQLAQEVQAGIEYRRISVAGIRLCNGLAKGGAKLFRKFRYLNSGLYYGPYGLRIATDLRQQQCDIVHIHNFSQFVPVIRALNPKLKIVLHMHCEWLSQFDRKVIAQRLAQCDLIIGCSDYITEKIRGQFPEFADKCQRVYNGVDIQQFDETDDKTDNEVYSQADDETDDKTGDKTDDPNVLFVGRISPEKGLHTLVAAFEKVAAKFPTAQLYLVGPNKPTSAEFIAELSDDPIVRRLADLDPPNYPQNLQNHLPLHLKERVFFTGAVSHLELHRYFQRASVLVNPSLSEAFGMSLVEAMATGTPTIATKVGGMCDVIVPEKTGLLVPPDQPEALALAICRLLDEPELRASMGRAGRLRATEIFSWEAIATSLWAHYQALLPRGGNGL
ncbi:MAG: glycosyltransferase family 1 protein [Phormidesmis priestleyi]|uniref:Glycosyltransferase family 1 protein n=1 Tax=Phormidesmis priestleyi TaxID=268141 RepID=A0A2W4XIR4_9CYAN|nr:MAG: glycosyltransferase family 1 protein [Phormidesmis priestleyi]